jgi:hypothetical protein
MSDQINQNMLVKGMFFGAFITLILGIIVYRMEDEMVNSGNTGFESEGALFGLLGIILATVFFLYLAIVFSKNQGAPLKDVKWDSLLSLKGVGFFSVVFLIGFIFIPRVFYGFFPPAIFILMILMIAYISTKIFE